MIKYYIATEWSRFSEQENHFYALYVYNPVIQSCYSTGKARMSLGQLLVHIDCPELNNWQFADQTILCGYTARCYQHLTENSVNVKIIVIGYHPTIGIHAKVRAEKDDEEINTKAGGSSMEKNQLSYKFQPKEFQQIYNLLVDEKLRLEKENISCDQNDEELRIASCRHEIISNMVARMRQDMDDWLLHQPLHIYTKWRISQLRMQIKS